MSVRISMPGQLQSELAVGDGVEIEGRTVQECLTELATRYPGLGPHLFSADGRLSLPWMVYLNDRLLTSTSALSHSVKDGDTVGLFPVVAGG